MDLARSGRGDEHHGRPGRLCRRRASRLRASDVRIELDTRNEKIGYKIREARQQKVPYMLITGDREKDEGTVTVRERSGDQKTMTLEEFIRIIRESHPVI